MMNRNTEMVWKNVNAAHQTTWNYVTMIYREREWKREKHPIFFFWCSLNSAILLLMPTLRYGIKIKLYFFLLVVVVIVWTFLLIAGLLPKKWIFSSWIRECRKLEGVAPNHSFNVYSSADWNKSHQCQQNESKRASEKKRETYTHFNKREYREKQFDTGVLTCRYSSICLNNNCIIRNRLILVLQ